MPIILVTLDTSHLEMSPLNDDALANMDHVLATLDTSHFEMSPLNDDADPHMDRMLVTLDTSHFERSPLNLFAPGTRLLFASTNKLCISATAETSHDPIGPCGPLEQSVDSFRHSTMAAWNSSLDFGAQPMVGYYYRAYAVGVRVRVTTIIRVRIRVTLRARVRATFRHGGRAMIRGSEPRPR